MAVVTVSAVAVFAYNYYFSPVARYQRNRDVDTLRYLLSTQLDSGNSVREVTALLGKGERASNEHVDRLLRWRDAEGQRKFFDASFPEGVEKTDVFLFYPAEPKGSYRLQFRDGKLINFDPSLYEGPDEMIGSLGS